MRRRDVLKSAVFAAAAAPLGARALPAPPLGAVTLRAARRVIEVDGKPARVLGLLRADGGQGVALAPGERFAVRLVNELNEPTIIHWHGQTPGWFFDGVADTPLPLLRPGEIRDYDFAAAPGTHFMHAHTLQEQSLLAAPLIVRTADDLRRDAQEVSLFLHDFSFKSPEELLAGLTQTGQGADHATMNHGAMNHATMNHAAPPAAALPRGLDLDALNKPAPAMDHAGHAGHGAGAMDLNDIDYDAYLANDRTLADPEVVRVARGGRVRLRVVNAAAATAFHIDLGALRGEIVAVDGQPVGALAGRRIPLAIGQRVDLAVKIPSRGGAFPIFALREGGRERAGLILATQGARVAKLRRLADTVAPPLALTVEAHLRAAAPLAARHADRLFRVALSGDMQPYRWALDADAPLRVRAGERVEIEMSNRSMMSHPMHLHGHHFQVVAIDGAPVSGALRDTVLIPPGRSLRIAFDADNPGKWMFHCHHLYHMFTGMMAQIDYEGIA